MSRDDLVIAIKNDNSNGNGNKVQQ